jgi:hypothetical protein
LLAILAVAVVAISCSQAPPAPTPIALNEAVKLASEVNAERLMADVRWMADDARRGRLSGSPEEDIVGEWLVARYQDLELESFSDAGLDSYYLPFTVPAVTGFGRAAEGDTAQAENVIGILPGTTRPDSYVLVGAHYDHIGVWPDGQVCNGADDDATGVAAVLEAARILSQAENRPQETIVFVAFSGEEIGTFGSRTLCERLAEAQLTDDALLLNLEVLGAQQGTGTYLDVWDQDVNTTETLVDAVQMSGEHLDITVRRQDLDPGSDARRMLECGVPAVSMDVAWSFENHPHYHKPSDDPEHIDVEGLEGAAQVTVATLWLLANDGQ